VRLLIDTVHVGSPGGQQNQLEITRAAHVRRRDGWEIVLLQDAASMPYDAPGVRVERLARVPGWTGMWRWYHRDLPAKALDLGADVVYSLSGIVPRALARAVGTVNSVNNMLPFTPIHLRHFPWSSRDRWRLEILNRLYVAGSKNADALVVPSRHGGERVSAYAGDLSAKTFVAMNPVPEYVRPDPARPPAHPYGGRPFLFYLSVVFWYKNHLNLIEAYRRALVRGEALPDLLMAGPPDDAAYVRRIEAAIGAAGLAARVKYLGKIPRADIPGLLHHAVVNVFPSTCETNSFVQGEILGAHGVMACSNVAPMPEIAGDAAELFDPFDPDSIAATLVRLCADPARRAELRRLAAARAAGFTVEACGEAMWRAVDLAAAQVARRRRA
jgi:glycosyltransferase involved in cell wall biosynthesis